MYNDFIELDCSIEDDFLVKDISGYNEEFINVFSNGLATSPVKLIYDFLLEEVIYRNESLIPSRNEKKSINVKWSLAWQNFKIMKGLTATERCFAWKIQQYMLPVGNRIHRKNAERRCLTELENNQICIEVQTLQHCFASCPMVRNVYEAMRFVLTDFLERSVSFDEIIHFSFN